MTDEEQLAFTKGTRREIAALVQRMKSAMGDDSGNLPTVENPRTNTWRTYAFEKLMRADEWLAMDLREMIAKPPTAEEDEAFYQKEAEEVARRTAEFQVLHPEVLRPENQ